MSYYGDVRLGETIDIKFTTRSSTGAPTTLSGSPAFAAYVGNSTTEITVGLTLTVDFDARTGLNNARVVASSGNGFATQTNVALVITSGTVGGVSVVGETIGTFSIENRSALMPAVAARTIDVGTTGAVAITSNVKQNQALSGFPFLMTDSTTHIPVTGKTVTVTRSIDGGAFLAGGLAAVSELSNGVYVTSFAASDLNGKMIMLRATASGCDDTFVSIATQA